MTGDRMYEFAGQLIVLDALNGDQEAVTHQKGADRW
jgi:hypothetical protein